MSIPGKLPPLNPNPPVQPAKPVEKPHAGAGKAEIKGDRVALSEEARLLQAAREEIRRMPDMDAAKVARIKAQLKDGTYQVDGQRIASKMLSESLLKEIDEIEG